jgi:hypothetical protein
MGESGRGASVKREYVGVIDSKWSDMHVPWLFIRTRFLKKVRSCSLSTESCRCLILQDRPKFRFGA